MRIGIDISQIVYEGSGVARFVSEMVRQLATQDQVNEYVLFASSLRQRGRLIDYFKTIKQRNRKVELVILPLPLTLLDLLWNKWQMFPVEWLVGKLDVFWSSDWTQPPLIYAKGVTTIHDVSFLRYPEAFAQKIIDVHKRRLEQVKKICQIIFCDSQATKRDLIELLHFSKEKLVVIYPGLR